MVKYGRKDVEEVKSNMGKLIIIEGTDGSGKQTQTELLYEKLFSQGKK
jgi:thymidylate kinase